MGGFGRNCPACNFPSGLRIVQEFIPGVWPSGPYLDEYTDADAPQFNIPKVLFWRLCMTQEDNSCQQALQGNLHASIHDFPSSRMHCRCMSAGNKAAWSAE